MKHLPSSFFIVLVLSIAYLFIGSWYWPCKVKGLCGDSPLPISENQADLSPEQPATDTREYFSLPFQLMENGQTIIASEAGIRFGRNSEQPVFGSEVSGKMNDLADFLRKEANKDLVITGIYSPEDHLPAGNKQSNLGLARANAFKQLLLQKGIPANQMISLYERSDEPWLYDASDSLHGGIRLALSTRKAAGKTAENPLIEPLFVYFETGSSYVRLDSSLRESITRTIQYLNSQPGSSLQFIGHTDDQGDAASNLKLGLGRANDLAKTFIEFGLSAEQVNTFSKGEAEPIASNDTDEGRAQNRRVEMRIPSKN